MAENKRSIILYCDLIHTVEKLTDDEAGKLLKHLLRYVNDMNPVPPDRLTEMIFEPLKQNLKRDLKNWEDIKSKKSHSGFIGNLKKWHPDIYTKFIEKLITKEEAIELIEGRKTSHSDGIIAPNLTELNKKQDLTEFLFADLPNSQVFEESCIRSQIKKDEIIKKLPEFKKVARPDYKNMSDLIFHFKNWYLKSIEKNPLPIKPIKKLGA